MKLTIEIRGDNAAFWWGNANAKPTDSKSIYFKEYARILKGVIGQFKYGTKSGKLNDINGNTVGHFELKEEG